MSVLSLRPVVFGASSDTRLRRWQRRRHIQGWCCWQQCSSHGRHGPEGQFLPVTRLRSPVSDHEEGRRFLCTALAQVAGLAHLFMTNVECLLRSPVYMYEWTFVPERCTPLVHRYSRVNVNMPYEGGLLCCACLVHVCLMSVSHFFICCVWHSFAFFILTIAGIFVRVSCEVRNNIVDSHITLFSCRVLSIYFFFFFTSYVSDQCCSTLLLSDRGAMFRVVLAVNL